MALFSRKNIKSNPYGLTEEDSIGEIEGFPMGVVVRMLEEHEKQGNKPDLTVFQRNIRARCLSGGFDWDKTEAGFDFWYEVIEDKSFKYFFERYPECRNFKRSF